jgi:hypothetical protein
VHVHETSHIRYPRKTDRGLHDFELHLLSFIPDPNAGKQDLAMLANASRIGRELQVFRLARSCLQNTSVNNQDRVVHPEISQTGDENNRCLEIELVER